MRRTLSVLCVTLLLRAPSLRAQGMAVTRTQEALATRIRDAIGRVPGAEVAVSVRDLASGVAVDVAPNVVFHAASTMKLPVMLAVLRAVDERRLALDQGIRLVNRFHSIVDGSPYALDAGDDSDSSMYARVGTRVSVQELLTRMIVRSSNLATNALISIVGAEAAEADAHALGAGQLRVLRGVEDSKAFAAGLNNTVTACDLAVLLAHVERGDALTPASARLMKEILLRQEQNEEIPAGVPPGTPVAHKTGSITATLHDAALVYPPGRPPYILVVLTRNIRDEAIARALIIGISRDVWNALVAPGAGASPVAGR